VLISTAKSSAHIAHGQESTNLPEDKYNYTAVKIKKKPVKNRVVLISVLREFRYKAQIFSLMFF
jgi:hypothetical protein